MSKKLISVALTVISGSAIAWGMACSSSNSSGNPDSGTSSSSSSSGGSSSSSGSGSSSGSSSSSGSGSSSGVTDSGPADAGNFCRATSSSNTLDNQTNASGQISAPLTFSPTGCGTTGSWFDYNSTGGMTSPSTFAFSPLPAGLPADAGAPTTGSSDASTGDGGASGPMAACISGMTGPAQYSTNGLGFNIGVVPNTDAGTGNALQVLFDGSKLADGTAATGIQFWAYGAADAGSQSVFFSVNDLAQSNGFGICAGPNGTGGTACGGDRTQLTFMSGWKLYQVPFALLVPVTGYSDMNGETVVDPTTLTQMQWQIQEPVADGGGVPFNFCIAEVSLY